MKRLTSVILAVLLLLPPAFALGIGTESSFSPSANYSGTLGGGLLRDIEGYITQSIPMRDRLHELGLSIRAFGGLREYNRIFISGDELIPNIDPAMDTFVRENTAAILRFAGEVGVPTYCMLIPTVSAIRQQSLPQFTETQVLNQKQLIDDVYSDLVGKVTVADAYSALFNAREQYIYYRTEDNLTSLGGYHLYTVLSSKMLEGISPRMSLGDYDIEYVGGDYYGELYRLSPFKDARADVLCVFRYARSAREYTVTHRGSDGSLKTYHTLYPLHLLELGRDMDIYLGGVSAVTRISSTAPYRTNLLVLGDKTALAYLPFLADHYHSVTLVDLFQLDAEGYDSLSLYDYEQVLFAYGIETYMQSRDPSRATRLLASLEAE